MKNYEVAVILTLRTKSYKEALEDAKLIAEKILNNELARTYGENIRVVKDYERDNEGQRVVYLPSVDE